MANINNPFSLPQSGGVGSGGDDALSGIMQLLIANIQDVTQAVNNLNVTLTTVFPQQGGTASTASAGSATLPSHPVEFLEVTVGGTLYKVPLYAD